MEHARLVESLRGKLTWLSGEAAFVEHLQAQLDDATRALHDAATDIAALDLYHHDHAAVQDKLLSVGLRVNQTASEAKHLIGKTKSHYITEGRSLPQDVASQLSSLELEAESLVAKMEDEHQEAKRARTIRFEYNRDVESVQAWIQAAEAKVQDKSVEPHKLKEFLQEIHCEIGSVTDQLERLTRHGHMICQRTSNQGERELVANTITSLTEQLQQVKNWLEDKKAQVGDSLESWQLFIQLYNSLRSWVERQRNFLSEPLKFATLPEARGKLQEYAAAVKDCKWANKQAAEMTAELAKIGQCSDVGPLTDKQAEMEQEKADVESNLKEVMALLQEMAEEWEQCERKSKDVAGWIEKTRQSLDNPQNKKRSLRDQLANREKVLADVSIQKTKLVMAMEKLQVHFRDRMCAEAQVSHENEKLQRRLDELQVAVKEDCRTLEACVHQMDAYQQEIQRLRQQMVGVEQQLRIVSSPTYSPRDRDKAVAEQNIEIKEKVSSAQEKLQSFQERLQSLVDHSVIQQLTIIQTLIIEMKRLEDELNYLEEKGKRLEQDSEVLSLQAKVSGLTTRLKTVLAQAHTKRTEIEGRQSTAEQQKLHLIEYQQLLQDLECWVTETYNQITADISLSSSAEIREQIANNQTLQRDLCRREQQLMELQEKCERVEGDSHIISLAKEMTDHLTFLSQTISDTRFVLQNRLHQLKEILANEEMKRHIISQDKDSESTIGGTTSVQQHSNAVLYQEGHITKSMKNVEKPKDDSIRSNSIDTGDAGNETETLIHGNITTIQQIMQRGIIKNITIIDGKPVETEEIVEEPDVTQSVLVGEGKDILRGDMMAKEEGTKVHKIIRQRIIKKTRTDDGKIIETEEEIEPEVINEQILQTLPADSVITKTITDPEVTTVHKIIRKKVIKKIVIIDGKPVETEEVIEEPEEVTEEMLQNLPADSVITETVTDPEVTTVHKIIRRKVVKKIVIINGKPVETEEVIEEPEEVTEEMLENVPADSIITETVTEPEVTTVHKIIRRRVIKKIIIVDGKPVETEEVIEDPEEVTEEMLQNLPADSVITETVTEPEVTTVRKIIRRVIKKIIIVDGKPVETEEVIEEPEDVTEEIDLHLTEEKPIKTVEVTQKPGRVYETLQNLPCDTVIQTVTEPKVTTVHKIIRRRVIKKIVIIDGKPVEKEEVIEEPEEVTEEMLQNLPDDSVITETVTEPEVTTVHKIIRRRVIKKIVIIDGKPVETEEVIEEPEDMTEEMLQNLPADSVITETATDPEVTSVHKIIRRRVIKKIVIIDGKPVETEEVIEEPEEVTEEMLENLPADSVITETVTEPEVTTVHKIIRRRVIKKIIIVDGKPVETEEIIEEPEEVSKEMLQNLPADSVITETVTEPEVTTVHKIIRRRVIKKIVIIDGKPVETEEILEEPEEVTEEMLQNLPADSVITETVTDPEVTTVHKIIRRRVIKKIVIIDGKPVETEEVIEEPEEVTEEMLQNLPADSVITEVIPKPENIDLHVIKERPVETENTEEVTQDMLQNLPADSVITDTVTEPEVTTVHKIIRRRVIKKIVIIDGKPVETEEVTEEPEEVTEEMLEKLPADSVITETVTDPEVTTVHKIIRRRVIKKIIIVDGKPVETEEVIEEPEEVTEEMLQNLPVDSVITETVTEPEVTTVHKIIRRRVIKKIVIIDGKPVETEEVIEEPEEVTEEMLQNLPADSVITETVTEPEVTTVHKIIRKRVIKKIIIVDGKPVETEEVIEEPEEVTEEMLQNLPADSVITEVIPKPENIDLLVIKERPIETENTDEVTEDILQNLPADSVITETVTEPEVTTIRNIIRKVIKKIIIIDGKPVETEEVIEEPEEVSEEMLQNIPADSVITETVTEPEVTPVHKIIRRRVIKKIIIVDGKPVETEEVIEEPEEVTEEMLQNLPADSVITETVTEPEVTTVHKIIRRRVIKKIVIIDGKPVETEEVLEEPEEVTEEMWENLPADSVIAETITEPEVTTVHKIIRRRVIKKIIIVDGKPVETEEVIEEPEEVTEEMLQNLPADSVITETITEPEVTTVHKIIRRRVIKKIIIVDGKPVETEEVIEEPEEVTEEMLQNLPADSVITEVIPMHEEVDLHLTEEKPVKTIEFSQKPEKVYETMQNLPSDSVITDTVPEPEVSTVHKIIRRRVIKKIVIIDGKPVETEEVIEEPEEVTEEMLQNLPAESVITETVTEPEVTTVRKIIRRRVIKKIIIVDGKPVETEEVIEEPEEVTEEMMQNLPADSVITETVTEPEVATVRKIIRRVIKKIIMVDGKPMETEEIIEEPEEMTAEMLQNLPADSVITGVIPKPEDIELHLVKERLVEAEEPEEVTEEMLQNLPADSVITETTTEPEMTTVHKIVRRRVIKKVVIIDGKPVETEEVIEEPEEMTQEMQENLPSDSVISEVMLKPEGIDLLQTKEKSAKTAEVTQKPEGIFESMLNLPADSVITETFTEPEVTTVHKIIRRRVIKKIVIIDGKPVETEEVIEEPQEVTEEMLQNLPADSVITETVTSPEVTTVHKIFRRRVIKKIVIIDGKPVETEEVIEEPEEVTEEMLQNLPPDSVITETVTEPEITTVSKIIRRRVIRKIIMVDGKPVEKEEIIEDPEDITEEMLQSVPPESLITEAISEPESVRRKVIKKTVIVDGKPVETEEVVEGPSDVRDDSSALSSGVRIVKKNVKIRRTLQVVDGKEVINEEREESPEEVQEYAGLVSSPQQITVPISEGIESLPAHCSTPDGGVTAEKVKIVRKLKIVDGHPILSEEILEDQEPISEREMTQSKNIKCVVIRKRRQIIKRIQIINGERVETEEIVEEPETEFGVPDDGSGITVTEISSEKSSPPHGDISEPQDTRPFPQPVTESFDTPKEAVRPADTWNNELYPMKNVDDVEPECIPGLECDIPETAVPDTAPEMEVTSKAFPLPVEDFPLPSGKDEEPKDPQTESSRLFTSDVYQETSQLRSDEPILQTSEKTPSLPDLQEECGTKDTKLDPFPEVMSSPQFPVEASVPAPGTETQDDQVSGVHKEVDSADDKSKEEQIPQADRKSVSAPPQLPDVEVEVTEPDSFPPSPDQFSALEEKDDVPQDVFEDQFKSDWVFPDDKDFGEVELFHHGTENTSASPPKVDEKSNLSWEEVTDDYKDIMHEISLTQDHQIQDMARDEGSEAPSKEDDISDEGAGAHDQNRLSPDMFPMPSELGGPEEKDPAVPKPKYKETNDDPFPEPVREDDSTDELQSASEYVEIYQTSLYEKTGLSESDETIDSSDEGFKTPELELPMFPEDFQEAVKPFPVPHGDLPDISSSPITEVPQRTGNEMKLFTSDEYPEVTKELNIETIPHELPCAPSPPGPTPDFGNPQEAIITFPVPGNQFPDTSSTIAEVPQRHDDEVKLFDTDNYPVVTKEDTVETIPDNLISAPTPPGPSPVFEDSQEATTPFPAPHGEFPDVSSSTIAEVPQKHEDEMKLFTSDNYPEIRKEHSVETIPDNLPRAPTPPAPSPDFGDSKVPSFASPSKAPSFASPDEFEECESSFPDFQNVSDATPRPKSPQSGAVIWEEQHYQLEKVEKEIPVIPPSYTEAPPVPDFGMQPPSENIALDFPSPTDEYSQPELDDKVLPCTEEQPTKTWTSDVYPETPITGAQDPIPCEEHPPMNPPPEVTPVLEEKEMPFPRPGIPSEGGDEQPPKVTELVTEEARDTFPVPTLSEADVPLQDKTVILQWTDNVYEKSQVIEEEEKICEENVDIDLPPLPAVKPEFSGKELSFPAPESDIAQPLGKLEDPKDVKQVSAFQEEVYVQSFKTDDSEIINDQNLPQSLPGLPVFEKQETSPAITPFPVPTGTGEEKHQAVCDKQLPTPATVEKHDILEEHSIHSENVVISQTLTCESIQGAAVNIQPFEHLPEPSPVAESQKSSAVVQPDADVVYPQLTDSHVSAAIETPEAFAPPLPDIPGGDKPSPESLFPTVGSKDTQAVGEQDSELPNKASTELKDEERETFPDPVSLDEEAARPDICTSSQWTEEYYPQDKFESKEDRTIPEEIPSDFSSVTDKDSDELNKPIPYPAPVGEFPELFETPQKQEEEQLPSVFPEIHYTQDEKRDKPKEDKKLECLALPTISAPQYDILEDKIDPSPFPEPDFGTELPSLDKKETLEDEKFPEPKEQGEMPVPDTPSPSPWKEELYAKDDISSKSTTKDQIDVTLPSLSSEESPDFVSPEEQSFPAAGFPDLSDEGNDMMPQEKPALMFTSDTYESVDKKESEPIEGQDLDTIMPPTYEDVVATAPEPFPELQQEKPKEQIHQAKDTEEVPKSETTKEKIIIDKPVEVTEKILENLPGDSVITETVTEPEVTTVHKIIRRRIIKKIVIIDGKPVETEEVIEEPEEVSEEMLQNLPADSVITETVTEPKVTTVHKIIRRRVIKKIVIIDGKPVETEEIIEEPEEVTEEMLQNLPADSIITETVTEPEVTTVHKIIRRVIKKIIMVDGKPVETEEVIEEPEEVTEEMLQNLPADSVITETVTEPEVTTVHKIIRRRVIKKTVIIDGKPVETEEVIEEPEEVTEEILQNLPADSVITEVISKPEDIELHMAKEKPVKTEEPEKVTEEMLQNLPADSVITEAVTEPEVTTVHKIIRRRMIKKIVIIDGKPVETEEVIEEPEEVTEEMLQNLPDDSVITEVISEPKEVDLHLAEVKTADVKEEPEKVTEEMLQNLSADSVITETVTEPEVTTVHKIIRRRVIKKTIMIDGKPVESEEVIEEPEEVTEEMLENLPADSVITETLTEPEVTTVYKIIRRRVIRKIVNIDGKPVETEEVIEEPEEVTEEILQNLPADSVITETATEPEVTTVHKVIRRVIKKITMVDGKPVETEEVIEEPEEVMEKVFLESPEICGNILFAKTDETEKGDSKIPAIIDAKPAETEEVVKIPVHENSQSNLLLETSMGDIPSSSETSDTKELIIDHFPQPAKDSLTGLKDADKVEFWQEDLYPQEVCVEEQSSQLPEDHTTAPYVPEQVVEPPLPEELAPFPKPEEQFCLPVSAPDQPKEVSAVHVAFKETVYQPPAKPTPLDKVVIEPLPSPPLPVYEEKEPSEPLPPKEEEDKDKEVLATQPTESQDEIAKPQSPATPQPADSQPLVSVPKDAESPVLPHEDKQADVTQETHSIVPEDEKQDTELHPTTTVTEYQEEHVEPIVDTKTPQYEKDIPSSESKEEETVYTSTTIAVVMAPEYKEPATSSKGVETVDDSVAVITDHEMKTDKRVEPVSDIPVYEISEVNVVDRCEVVEERLVTQHDETDMTVPDEDSVKKSVEKDEKEIQRPGKEDVIIEPSVPMEPLVLKDLTDAKPTESKVTAEVSHEDEEHVLPEATELVEKESEFDIKSEPRETPGPAEVMEEELHEKTDIATSSEVTKEVDQEPSTTDAGIQSPVESLDKEEKEPDNVGTDQKDAPVIPLSESNIVPDEELTQHSDDLQVTTDKLIDEHTAGPPEIGPQSSQPPSSVVEKPEEDEEAGKELQPLVPGEEETSGEKLLVEEQIISQEWQTIYTLLKRRQNLREAPQSSLPTTITTLMLAPSSPPSPDQQQQQIDENLEKLKSALDKKELIVVQKVIISIVETVSTWLETIEYRIYTVKNTEDISERNQQYEYLQTELHIIEEKLVILEKVTQSALEIFSEETIITIIETVKCLRQQVNQVEKVRKEQQENSKEEEERYTQYMDAVANAGEEVSKLKAQLYKLQNSKMTPEEKLRQLELLLITNEDTRDSITQLLLSSHDMRLSPSRHMGDKLASIQEELCDVHDSVEKELDQVLRLTTTTTEYEETLMELTHLIEMAETILEARVVARDHSSLVDTITKHKKLFLSLRQCQKVLESLDTALEPNSRVHYQELYSRSYLKASKILDKATQRNHQLTLLEAEWLRLLNQLKEEEAWMMSASEQVTQLHTLSSDTYQENTNSCKDCQVCNDLVINLITQQTSVVLRGFLLCIT
ncbi:hypothetical protein O3P69_015107 [Scylla paramamosain]|uniref:KASH domain-containing protein n=1 Tax=Scylla paramamosain TaxID=85552 RepID=A0AAW0T4I2_SCYPA